MGRKRKPKGLGAIQEPSLNCRLHRDSLRMIRRRLKVRRGASARLAEHLRIPPSNLTAYVGPHPKRPLALSRYLAILEWLGDNGL